MVVWYEDCREVIFLRRNRVRGFLPIGGWELHPDRACAGIIQKIPDTRGAFLESNSTRQD